MPFCQCGKPLGAADKFCQACGCKTTEGTSPSSAAGGAAAAQAAGSVTVSVGVAGSASLRAGTGPSSNRGTDWLPSEFHRSGGKYGGSEAETEAVLGAMMEETNRVFGQLGVSVSAERRQAQGADAAGEVGCDECKRAIRNEAAVQAQGRTLHAACFTCCNCGKTIGSESFVARAGKPWCDGCATKTKAVGAQGALGKAAPGGGFVSPSVAGVPPFKPASAAGNNSNNSSSGSSGLSQNSTSGGKFGSAFGCGSNSNSMSSAHSAPSAIGPKPSSSGGSSGSGSGLTAAQRDQFLTRRDAGKTYCSGCGTVMMGEGVTTPSGAVYHVGCFLCARCSLPIGGGEAGGAGDAASFAERDGQPFHPGCAPAAAGSTASCATCHKSLSGKFVKASDGATHHRDCFRCASCAGDLAAGYALRDGRPHCASCVRSNPPPPARTVAAAAAQSAKDMGGIRYNHVTHQVSRVPPPPTAGQPAGSVLAFKSGAAGASTIGAFCAGCGGALGGSKFCPSCGAQA